MIEGLTLAQGLFLGAGALLIGMAKNGLPGIGILVVPCMVAALPAREAMGVLLPMLILGDLLAVRNFRAHCDWSQLRRLGVWIAVGLLVAWALLGHLDDEALKRWLGGLLLLLVVLQILRSRARLDRWADHMSFTAGIGFLAGFSSTLANLAGPIVGVYLVGKHLDKTALVGTSAVLFLLLNLTKVPVYILQDMTTKTTMGLSLLMLPVIVLGALCGIAIHKVIPQALFNAIILGVAILAALLLIVS